MAIDGFTEYRRREYCNCVSCPVQVIMNRKGEGSDDYGELREICRKKCMHTAYEFHHWLNDAGFIIARPDKKDDGGAQDVGNEEQDVKDN